MLFEFFGLAVTSRITKKIFLFDIINLKIFEILTWGKNLTPRPQKSSLIVIFRQISFRRLIMKFDDFLLNG